MNLIKRTSGSLAAVVLTFGAATAITSPVVAAAAPAAASPCPDATGAAWNARNPDKQQAADLGPLVPGVNAGPIGTDVACMPVPALDFASTAEYHRTHPGVAAKSRIKRIPGKEAVTPEVAAGKAATRGRSLPVEARRLAACTSQCWFYATGRQLALSGVTSHTWTQRVAKPGLGSDGLGGGHTLAEGTVQAASTAVPGGLNDVELGTTVDAVICGGTGVSPCIFVFSFFGGTPGSYNGGGWVNVTGCSPCMGTSVTSWVGTSKTFSLSHLTSPARWCASANNQYVACIADTYWSSSEFSSGTGIQEFFEVAVGSSNTTTPNTDMGDAILADCTVPQGSYFINSKYNGTTVANLTTLLSATGGAVTDPTKYNVCSMPGRTDYFRGGGPGY